MYIDVPYSDAMVCFGHAQVIRCGIKPGSVERSFTSIDPVNVK
jgi:hypothetical protein